MHACRPEHTPYMHASCFTQEHPTGCHRSSILRSTLHACMWTRCTHASIMPQCPEHASGASIYILFASSYSDPRLQRVTAVSNSASWPYGLRTLLYVF